MLAFPESHTYVTTTFVAALEPVLQTLAPERNSFGPVFTSLLSRPTTFHVIGVIVRLGAALARSAASGTIVSATSSTDTMRAIDARARVTVGGDKYLMVDLSTLVSSC